MKWNPRKSQGSESEINPIQKDVSRVDTHGGRGEKPGFFVGLPRRIKVGSILTKS